MSLGHLMREWLVQHDKELVEKAVRETILSVCDAVGMRVGYTTDAALAARDVDPAPIVRRVLGDGK